MPFEQALTIYAVILLGAIFLTLLTSIKLLKVFSLYKKANRQLPKQKNVLIQMFRYSHKGLVAVLFLSLVAIGLTSTKAYSLVTTKPYVNSSSVKDGGVLASLDAPLTFEFSAPIYAEKLVINSHPELEGSWDFDEYSVGSLKLARKVTFNPTLSYEPDSEIIIYFSYISNPVYPKSGNEYAITFKTPPPPKVIKISPDDKATDIAAQSEVEITLDRADSTSKWELETTPPIKIEQDTQGNKIIFKPTDLLEQDTKYQVKLKRIDTQIDLSTQKVIHESDPVLVKEWSLKTVAPPLIKEFKPKGESVKPTNSLIVITFDEPMDKASIEQYLKIAPQIATEYSWDEQGKILTITPTNPLQKETKYEVIIGQGSKSQIGGVLMKDVIYNFTTLGKVKVVATNPASKTSGASITAPIKVTFDQEVDHKSAQGNFTISPNIQGSFSWQGNTLIFTPSHNLNYQTTYTVTLTKGIKSIYGTDSQDNISFSFTTRAQVVNLPVTLLKQQEMFTCNIAALRMLLNYRGVSFSEAQVKQLVGTNGVKGSGNPHKGFVENYGTYWEPIQTVANKYRQTKLLTQTNIQTVLDEVEKGNPVMVWAQNLWSTPNNISWTASDGTYIYAISGMHSYVVKGFTGSKQNPTSIIVNDPWRGTWSIKTSSFVNVFNYFKVALVVY